MHKAFGISLQECLDMRCESNKIVLNCTILKVYLETNYDKNNKKKIIYVGSEDAYV